MNLRIWYVLFIMLFSLGVTAQKYIGLALPPPMGWNSWNTFKTTFSDTLIRETADQMIASGMKKACYEYIVLDDGWMAMQRDHDGNLVADSAKFPRGIKSLATYLHARGLKLGIYNCVEMKTCGGFPGTKGHELEDAKLYASRDVDYIKMDWCNTDGMNGQMAYTEMSRAIKEAGRPMVFSICEWGTNNPWEWAAPVGHLWRTTNDIYNCFDCYLDHATWYWAGPMQILDRQKGLRKYAGPDHWNDMDMLEVGKGMTVGEDRAHFSMWCMLASPLIAGNDLRAMSTETIEILTKKEAISIDQDSRGIQGFKYGAVDSLEIWCKPLSHGAWAICFLNRSAVAKKINFDWSREKIMDSLNHISPEFRENKYNIYNVWLTQNQGSSDKPFSGEVASHDVILLKLIKN